MPGPLPKSPEVRQRANKAATRAILPPESVPIEQRPRLPANADGAWHVMARRWWDEVWASPQRYEFMRADLGALYRLVDLVDQYWKTRELDIAREIRLLEREFGLTPLSRRRLEWSVTQVEEAKDRHEQRRSRRSRIIDGDPREVLDR